MPHVPVEDRTVIVIVEATDPRDLIAVLRAGLTLRTKADVEIGGELRMHVVAPATLSAEQSAESPVELRLNRELVVKPTKDGGD